MHRPAGFRGIFRTDELALSLYAEGAGIARVVPAAVAVPADAGDLPALVRWAHAGGHSLIARGSGSGMAGGAVGPGVIVDLSRLRDVEAVDAGSRSVRVGPGVLRAEVDAAARVLGLRFPVDPSSGAFATIGGMTATNAAGARSLGHGTMRSWVQAIDCVFDDGHRAVIRRGASLPAGIPAVARFAAAADELRAAGSALRRDHGPRKNSSGYALAEFASSGELLDLLVGSEGTLALFAGVELRLAPVAPATSSLLVTFDSLDPAVVCSQRCRELGASACELLDRTFLDVARQGEPSVPHAEAALLVEVEGENAVSAAASATSMGDACLAAGAAGVKLALEPPMEEALWALRHAASPILARLDPALRSMQFIEDGAIPPERLSEYVLGVRAALYRHGVRGVIFGHAGDAHVHVNPLVDTSADDWHATVERLLDEVVELTARLGGTLAGEHGDGRLRAPLLGRVWAPAAMAAFARVKEVFDPRGILNPGVKLAVPGQRAIGVVRHDPDAPPLHPVARAALDQIEHSRAWATFRLSFADEPR